MRKLLIPAGCTLANLALQISGYKNPHLAAVLLAGGVLSWAWWLISHENVKRWCRSRARMSLYLSITVGALVGGAAGGGWWAWQILPVKGAVPIQGVSGTSSPAPNPSLLSEADIEQLATAVAKHVPTKTVTHENEHFQEQLHTSDTVAATVKRVPSKAESPCLNPIPFTQEVKQKFDGVEVHYITAFSLVNEAGFRPKLHMIVHFDGPIYEVGPTTWGKQMQIGTTPGADTAQITLNESYQPKEKIGFEVKTGSKVVRITCIDSYQGEQ